MARRWVTRDAYRRITTETLTAMYRNLEEELNQIAQGPLDTELQDKLLEQMGFILDIVEEREPVKPKDEVKDVKEDKLLDKIGKWFARTNTAMVGEKGPEVIKAKWADSYVPKLPINTGALKQSINVPNTRSISITGGTIGGPIGAPPRKLLDIETHPEDANFVRVKTDIAVSHSILKSLASPKKIIVRIDGETEYSLTADADEYEVKTYYNGSAVLYEVTTNDEGAG
jgi:hypothetical protein